jgi:hypothetical protein
MKRLWVFEKRVLGTFELKKENIIRERKKLHSVELLNLLSSSNDIRMKKSRKIRWAGHAALLGDTTDVYIFSLKT